MQGHVKLEQALAEVKDLYEKVLGHPAPTVEPHGFVEFPPGVKPVDFAMQELQQLRMLSEQLAFAPAPVTWIPRADCFATRDSFIVRMEITDVDRDDLKIFFKDGECVVRGKRKQPEETAEMRLLSAERPWGPFERRFPLPMGADPDKIKARSQDGVLEIHVAVARAGTAREMQVEAA